MDTDCLCLKRALMLCVIVSSAAEFDSSSAFAQSVEIEIRNTADLKDDYLTWAPSIARIRLASAGAAAVPVVLTNDPPGDFPNGGDLVFGQSPIAAGQPASNATLSLVLPANGDWKEFVVAGKFGKASTEDKDAVMIVHANNAGGPELKRHATMVRVRKNALKLTSNEKKRFLEAVRDLRNANKYEVYQQIHSQNPMRGNPDAHFGSAFVAWHRVYILRFERDLQAINPAVSLPYWKFDESAPDLFSVDFMGANSVAATLSPEDEPPVNVQFASTNPLNGWTTDLKPAGTPLPATAQPLKRAPADRTLVPTLGAGTVFIRTESTTVSPSFFGIPSPTNTGFTTMEGNPHGIAHVWAGGGGSLGDIPAAVQDPLFFLLHCNVDRLWAKWQRRKPPNTATNGTRYDSKKNAFEPQSPQTFPAGGPYHIGHYLKDTMWPWNGATGDGGGDPEDRPGTAPGGAFPIVTVFAPSSATPRPLDVFDYQGRLDPKANTGFAYDDDQFVPDP